MRRAAGQARVWAVIKANAYGHGIEHVYAGLRGADGFALLDLAEAERVRALGWRGPILLLEGAFEPPDLKACARLDLWHAVHCQAQIDWLAGHETRAPQRVLLKLNSGMNRLGFAPARYRAAYARLAALPQVSAVGHMTHFANADVNGADGTPGLAAQLAVFNAATAGLPGERSLANSAALLRFGDPSGLAAQVCGDWVRPGIALYGSSPDAAEHGAAPWDLQPALTLTSRVLAVQQLEPGQSTGYGALFTAEAPARIGVVACGYADGYPRVAPSGTPVLVDGMRTRTLGRVSMDMLAVDLTALPQAGAGSEVTLWGQGPRGAVLPIDEVAHAAGTIGYELMCALAKRVPVRVVD
jgi:alanine racemase